MARTLNLAVHTVRREAFVDAALRLMQAKGYEQMSIQDLLDELNASRGAFYHYFDSKQELLEAVIERMVEVGLGSVQPIVEDSTLPAGRKLERLFSGIGRWKTERKSLVLAVLTVWLSDDNAIVREKFRRRLVHRLTPLLSTIIRQGVSEGSFAPGGSPEETARVLVILLEGFQDIATQLYIDRVERRVTLDEVETTFSNYTVAFERILGVPAGSIQLADEAVLRAWYG